MYLSKYLYLMYRGINLSKSAENSLGFVRKEWKDSNKTTEVFNYFQLFRCKETSLKLDDRSKRTRKRQGPRLCKRIISKLEMETNQILWMNNKMNMRRNSSTDNFTGTPDLIKFPTLLLFYVTVAVQVPIKTQCASQVANYVKQMSLTWKLNCSCFTCCHLLQLITKGL